MNDARTSASPGSCGVGQRQISQWACTVCRARKVKCDRILPNCTGCSNKPDGCKYETKRKKVERRSTYQDVVERLAKMESIVKEFSRTKVSTPTSSDCEMDPYPQTIPRVESTWLDPSSKPAFEDDRCPNPSAAPLSMDAQPNLAEFAPPLNYDGSTLVDNDLDVEYTGSFCIFSTQGIQWVNELVGDDCFSQAVSILNSTPPSQNRDCEALLSIHPLPTRSVMIDCVNDYLTMINRYMPLFDGEDIIRGVESYYSTGLSPSRSWFVAINVILGHPLRKYSGMQNSVECDKYIGNAMGMIPSIMMSKPNPLNAGAMVSMTLYFMLHSESQTAIIILGAAIQLMVLGGFHTPRRRPGQTCKEKLRERRQFWQAFVLDHDLALQVGKPPIIGPDFVIDLPDEMPEDGAGIVALDNGTTFNILREQVRLARIKSKVYSLLYAKDASKRGDHEEVKIIADLDSELYAWKARIPEVTKSGIVEEQDNKDPGLISLTILHYAYYQLIIVVHSFIFQSSSLVESDENFDRILSSVTLCVGAARATISLLNFHEDRHPFSIHLLNNVSWSLDIIFINILQNKGTIGAREDLNLLGRVISLFKKYDPNYTASISFRIAKVFYQVAWKALQNHALYQIPPPNQLPPPTDVRISKAWNRHTQPKPPPHDTSASNPLESTQGPFYNQTAATQSTFLSDQQTSATFNPTTDDKFYNPRLSQNSSNNMDWTGQDQGGLNSEWRLSLGLDPQHWQGLWNTAALLEEEI